MADKYLKNNGGNLAEVEGIIVSAGAGDSGKIAALDAAGKWAVSMMPTGIAADVATVEASEDLVAGNLVNIYDSTGAKCRKADATTVGKEAHGFVIAIVTNGNNATIYFEGSNDYVTGLTPGIQFLSTTAGLASVTAPSASGNIVQKVGVATSATSLNVEFSNPITLV